MKLLQLILFSCLMIISSQGFSTEQAVPSAVKVESIQVKELEHILKERPKNKFLIDVRTEREWKSVHATPAVHLPMDEVSPESLQKLAIQKDDTIYVICGSGGRSDTVAKSLRKQGYSNVVNVEGGTNAWVEAKLPIVK